ncbi:hypothetical protein OROGR_003003 [Orobanche gracilis]
MSCIQITACKLACSPSVFPAKAFRLKKASISPSAYLRTRFPKISLNSTSGTSRYQKAAIVCLFGGQGKSGIGNEASPWKVLEKAVSNFKKDLSIGDVLRQLIPKQHYYGDGGRGGKGPGGGRDGGDRDGNDDSFDEGESGGLWGIWDEFGQVILATLGLIFLYIYILLGEDLVVLVRDILKFLFTRKKSFRLTRLMDKWGTFLTTEKQEYEDPYWLERAILNTPTHYDHPGKYKWAIKVLESDSDDEQ